MLLPDVLKPGLDLVFCGTAPSRISFERRAYYANPGNSFWRTLAVVGLLPEPLTPERYTEVLRFGLGLTDLNKTEWGSDHELSPEGFDLAGLQRKLARYRPAAVAFTSKNAACLFFARRSLPAGPVPDDLPYALKPAALRNIRYFVLTSPSGRAKSWWSIEPWQAAAAFVAERRTR
jgi:TDG/mug DNA glycosylase family protein